MGDQAKPSPIAEVLTASHDRDDTPQGPYENGRPTLSLKRAILFA